MGCGDWTAILRRLFPENHSRPDRADCGIPYSWMSTSHVAPLKHNHREPDGTLSPELTEKNGKRNQTSNDSRKQDVQNDQPRYLQSAVRGFPDDSNREQHEVKEREAICQCAPYPFFCRSENHQRDQNSDGPRCHDSAIDSFKGIHIRQVLSKTMRGRLNTFWGDSRTIPINDKAGDLRVRPNSEPDRPVRWHYRTGGTTEFSISLAEFRT